MSKKSLILIFFCLPLLPSAQTSQNPWNIGLHYGKSEFDGDIGNASFDWTKPFYGFGGVSVAYYGNKSFDLLGNFNIGELGYLADDDSFGYYNGKFHGRFYGQHTDGSIYLKYKLSNGYIFKENSRLQLSFLLGVGISWLTGNHIYNVVNVQTSGGQVGVWTAKDLTVATGWHINFRLTENLNLYEQSVFVYTDHDGRDGYVSQNNDGYLLHTLGVSFNFGSKPKESAFYIGKEDISIAPRSMRTVNVMDRDSDGIIDKFDLCPDIPGTVQARGCPDKDWDGIPDFQDSCPNVWGLATFHGCPDTDGDGVPDQLDSCPHNPGPVSKNGCPETKEIQNTNNNAAIPGLLYDMVIPGIQFEPTQSMIPIEAYPLLDYVVSVCKENPTYHLIINGHADQTGSSYKNLILSFNRANSVREYLIKHGVAAERLEACGYGQDQPVDKTETPEGRAKNRRVEFRVKIVK
ncbi:MAG: OmpA family protein [Bacteroidia bacterium]